MSVTGAASSSTSCASTPASNLPAVMNPDNWIGQGVDAVLGSCRVRASQIAVRSPSVLNVLDAIDSIKAEDAEGKAMDIIFEYVDAKRRKDHIDRLMAAGLADVNIHKVSGCEFALAVRTAYRTAGSPVVPADHLAVTLKNCSETVVLDDASLVQRQSNPLREYTYPPDIWVALAEVNKLSDDVVLDWLLHCPFYAKKLYCGIDPGNRPGDLQPPYRMMSKPLFIALCRGDFELADKMLQLGLFHVNETQGVADGSSSKFLFDAIYLMFQAGIPESDAHAEANRFRPLVRSRFRQIITYLIGNGSSMDSSDCLFENADRSRTVLHTLYAELARANCLDFEDAHRVTRRELAGQVEDFCFCIDALKLDVNESFPWTHEFDRSTLMTVLQRYRAPVIELLKCGALCPSSFGSGEVSLAALATDSQNIHNNTTARRLRHLRTLAVAELNSAVARQTGGDSKSSATNVDVARPAADEESEAPAGLPTKQRRVEMNPKGAEVSAATLTVGQAIQKLLDRADLLQEAEVDKLRNGEQHCNGMSKNEIVDGIKRQLGRFRRREEDRGVASPDTQSQKRPGDALVLVYRYLHAKFPSDHPDMVIFAALLQAQNQYGPNRQTCDPMMLVLNLLEGRVTVPDPAEGAQVPSGPSTYVKTLRELRAHNTDQIIAEGQARLATLNRTKLLEDIYNLVTGGEALEYAKNRLRGLFFEQMLTDCDHDFAKYIIDDDDEDALEFIPAGLQRLLKDISEISCIFTEEFFSQRMSEAFRPFVSGATSSAA
ncbi:unnamed protein product [Amoebophrya sp. A120]|nr:unnamed protein product [Amoebophrya sp. A120]|eukprot:GSA120T00003673001.1